MMHNHSIGIFSCMICKEDRPEHRIDVHTESRSEPVQMSVNVRHCNDKKECIEGALNHPLLNIIRDGPEHE